MKNNSTTEPVTIAMVQMVATDDLTNNLRRMKSRIEEAARTGAQAVIFPELAYFSSSPKENGSVTARYAELLAEFCAWAAQNRIYVIPGSLREPVIGKKDRFFNTLPLISPGGKVLAEYRKIFLFKAALSDRNYDESEFCEAGDQVRVVETSMGNLGLGICFDLRFPEFFRAQRKQGAQIFLIPAAFTVPTGKMHWKPLLLARAIENQAFVIAPGQVGKSGEGSEKYGHSLAISPWGEILAELEEKEGLALVPLDLARISLSASRVDAWGCRREELFPIT